MAVTYTNEQREKAKQPGFGLVTLAAPGIEVQVPAPPEEVKLVQEFITGFLNRRAAWLKAQREQREQNG